MIKSKKQMFIVISLFTLLLFLGGTAYAWFTYSNTSGTSELVAGDIYFMMTPGNETLSLTNVFPESKEEARARNDNYITFTLYGKNDTNRDIYYDIVLNYGAGKEEPKQRYVDSDLVFDLIELDDNDNEVQYVVNAKSYDTINNKRIWVDTIDANASSEVSKKYKLRAWLSDRVIISDSLDNPSYTTNDFKNRYATIKVQINGDFTKKEIPNAYIMLRDSADTTTQIDFSNESRSNNGEGLYRLYGTENDTYPIIYYRGNINNNNVIFGGFCWQIVRTTDTGGIKMIYNGVATDNGTTCTNSSSSSRSLTPSSFNSSYYGMSYVGYMLNKEYDYASYAPTTDAYFGNSVEYGDFDNNGTNEYRLVSTSQTKDDNHHYSCDLTSATGTCTNLRYYFYNDKYIILRDGEDIYDAIYKMTGNGTDEVKARAINQNYDLNKKNSKVKTNIENWFKTNLTNEVDANQINYQVYLEDTIYCNDRSFKTIDNSAYPSVYETSGWYPNGGSTNDYIHFGIRNRLVNSWFSTTNVPAVKNTGTVPNIACPNETDRFSVGNPKAKLNYPVGLLTADEIVLAGAAGGSSNNNTNYYLYTGADYWAMTPYGWNGSLFINSVVEYYGDCGALAVGSATAGVRPVVSLKQGIEFESGGNGTPTNPYVVKYDN